MSNTSLGQDQPCSRCAMSRGNEARGSLCLRCWIDQVALHSQEAAQKLTEMYKDIFVPVQQEMARFQQNTLWNMEEEKVSV